MRRVAGSRPAGWPALPGARGLSVLLVLLAVVVTGPSARAESAAEAELAAKQASAQLAVLQHRVDAARAAYQDAIDGLAGAVNRSVSAQQRALAAVAAAAQAEDERARTVRALYANGGSMAFVASILSAGSPSELAARSAVNGRVLALLSDRVTVADMRSDAATAAADARDARTDRRIATVQDVEAAYQQLTLLLDRQQAVLDRLSTRARSLAKAEAAEQRLAAERAAAAAAAVAGAGQVTAAGIPAAYEALYRGAAKTCQGLPWPVLAAIGQVESGHGRSVGPSSAGAEGPMQFLPSTFAAYAVDGDRDGDTDIWDPADSIFTAAHYLCANGAGHGPTALYRAIWQYNHVDWYVVMVMNVAVQIAQRSAEPVPVATAP